jgi:integrase
VDVTVKGKRVTRFCDNLTIAREVEGTIRGDLVRGEFDITHHKVKKVVTLGDVWEKFSPWAKEHLKCWKTDEGFYRKHIAPRFAEKALDTIMPLDIERMKLELKKSLTPRGKPYSAQTIKHNLNLLSRLFNRAIKWGMFNGDNPVKKVQPVRVDNQKTEFLTDEEVERLLQVLDEWPCRVSATFVRFALFSGLRRGEIIKLQWNDVDFERGMVTLREPKGGKTQSIPLSNEAFSALRELGITGEYVFPGKSGGERYDFKGPWQRIRKAAGLPDDFRFHGLRHHFASTLVSNGVDLAVVKELLTHKDMATTQRYAHLAPDAVKRAALKSGELLKGKKKADIISLQEKSK